MKRLPNVKNTTKWIALFFICFSLNTRAQLDTVFDIKGRKYGLNNIRIPNTPGGQLRTADLTCGYFSLFLEPGCGFENGAADYQNRQNVLCRVFTDLSNFIVPGNSNVKVNMWIRKMDNVDATVCANSNSPTLGIGSSFYSLPSISFLPGTTTPVSGALEGEVWRTIISGKNSFINVSSPLSGGGGASGDYFHGLLSINFCNKSYQTVLTSSPVPSSVYDLYTVLLHEITHALGFGSLIDSNGKSKFPYTYYSTYDLFLKTKAGVKLLTNTGACNKYLYSFNSALNTNVMAPALPNCNNAIQFSSTNVLQSVYTPAAFSTGSSLSHFNDVCHSPDPKANNDYYVMSSGLNKGKMKRYYTVEERNVLCDLGYKTNRTFGLSSNINYNYYDYLSGCGTSMVAGTNDGINSSSGVFSYIVNRNNSITISDILANDFFDGQTGNYFECLQDLLGNGSVSTTGGVGKTSFVFNATKEGIALLRYVPVNASGKRGNITYLYILVIDAGAPCTTNSCGGLVNNGGFESASGYGILGSQGNVSCWQKISVTPDLFSRSAACSTGFSIPLSCYNYGYPYDTWDNNVNNKFFIAIGGSDGTNPFKEATQTALSSAILPGTEYIISFYALNHSERLNGSFEIAGTENINLGPINYDSNNPVYKQLVSNSKIIIPPDKKWHFISRKFTYTGANPLKNLILAGINAYVLIDDVSLFASSQVGTFTLPVSAICYPNNINITNLSQYATPPGGTFSGPGVVFSGGQYNFQSSLLGPGTHAIVYTYTNSNGCTIRISSEITIISISASAASATLCMGGNTTLIANGGTNYNWAPATSPTSGSPVTATPLTSTTYTVTETTSGCTSTVSVKVECCLTGATNIAAGTYTTGTLFTASNIVIKGDIIINGNITLNCPNVLMSPSAKITVNPSCTLTITNKSYLHACGYMWDGIYIKPGGTLIINGDSRIEDAQNAVVSIGGGKFTINTAIFNKNYKAIVMQAYPGDNPSRLQNSVITSRVLPASPTVAGIKTGLMTYNIAYLISPHNKPGFSEKPLLGVQVDAMNSAWVGQAGTSYTNYMDNLQCGVWTNGVTTMRVLNNVFTVIMPNPYCALPPAACLPSEPCAYDPPCPPTPIAGAAIDASTGTSFQGGVGTSTLNKFTNCVYGEYVRNYPSVNIQSNSFTNIALKAVYDETSTITSHLIRYNSFSNTGTGIHLYIPGPDYIANGPFTIELNTITNNGTFSYNGSVVQTNPGIMLEQPNAEVFTFSTPNPGLPTISNNTISNAITGIWARNFNTLWFDGGTVPAISNNSITANAIGSNIITGIKKTNSQYLQVGPSNVITGSSGTNTNIRGISMESNTQGYGYSNVVSNTINTCGIGIRAYGNNGQVQLACNKLNNTKWGVSLDNATIVAQGASGAPGNNQWVGTQTYHINGVGSFSSVDWWYKTIPSYYIPSVFNFAGVIIPKPTSGSDCSVPPPLAFGGGEPARRIGTPTSINSGADDSLQSRLTAMAEQKFTTGFANENTWYYANHVYNALRQKPDLLNKATKYDAKLDAFYRMAETQNHKSFADISLSLGKADIKTAGTINSGIIPGNVIETNLRDYNAIYLNTVALNKQVNDQQKSQLEAIAKQCPITGGLAVYYSRTLLGFASNSIVDYPDNCPAPKQQRTSGVEQGFENTINFIVYPNPNDGNMQMEYELGKDENGRMSISDVTGRKIAEYPLKEGKNVQVITETGLESGIYYYSVLINGKLTKSERLIIIR